MQLWILYGLGSALFAALVAIFGKLGLKYIDSTSATMVRSAIMTIFLILTTFALGKAHFINQIGSKDFLLIIASGISGALSWLCYFAALQAGPASAVAAIDRMSVVFVVIFALLFLGEPLTTKSFIGALLVVSGVILMNV